MDVETIVHGLSRIIFLSSLDLGFLHQSTTYVTLSTSQIISINCLFSSFIYLRRPPTWLDFSVHRISHPQLLGFA